MTGSRTNVTAKGRDGWFPYRGFGGNRIPGTVQTMTWGYGIIVVADSRREDIRNQQSLSLSRTASHS